MGSRRRGARWERRQFRRLTKDLDLPEVSGLDEPAVSSFDESAVSGFDHPVVGGFHQPAISGFDRPHRPRRHPAKDFLGAAVSLAIIGAFLLQLTDAAAHRCEAGPKSHTGPGSCSGPAAFAHHAQPLVTVSVAACAALAVIAFIWYLLWGYKTNGQASGTGPIVRS
jgi:hypothetical protein